MLNDLWPLTRLLRKRGYNISIESNGTIPIPDGLIDWICISQKINYIQMCPLNRETEMN